MTKTKIRPIFRVKKKTKQKLVLHKHNAERFCHYCHVRPLWFLFRQEIWQFLNDHSIHHRIWIRKKSQIKNILKTAYQSSSMKWRHVNWNRDSIKISATFNQKFDNIKMALLFFWEKKKCQKWWKYFEKITYKRSDQKRSDESVRCVEIGGLLTKFDYFQMSFLKKNTLNVTLRHYNETQNTYVRIDQTKGPIFRRLIDVGAVCNQKLDNC